MGLPAKIIRALPESLQQRLRRQYYPGVLRRYTADHWAYSTAIRPLIPTGGEVVDAGANVGYLSHLFAQWVGAGGRVHSFEPVPWTFDILASNFRKLGVANVAVYACALSDAAGRAQMQIPRYDDGRENLYESRIITPGTETRSDLRSVDVERVTLDALLLERTPKIDFIKIDVEGHELQVVRGASRILRRDHPPLLIEVSGDLSRDDEAAGQLRLQLAELGYAPYVLDPAAGITPWDGSRRCVDYLFLAESGR